MLGSVSRQVKEEDNNTRVSITRGPQLGQVSRRRTTTPSIRVRVYIVGTSIAFFLNKFMNCSDFTVV